MARGNKKEARKERALERLEVASQRTPEEQLARLDRMFGEGQGAARERSKLARRIEERNKAAQSKKTKEVESAVEVEEPTQPQDVEHQYRKKGKK